LQGGSDQAESGVRRSNGSDIYPAILGRNIGPTVQAYKEFYLKKKKNYFLINKDVLGL
jgi:hypothetical protein